MCAGAWVGERARFLLRDGTEAGELRAFIITESGWIAGLRFAEHPATRTRCLCTRVCRDAGDSSAERDDLSWSIARSLLSRPNTAHAPSPAAASVSFATMGSSASSLTPGPTSTLGNAAIEAEVLPLLCSAPLPFNTLDDALSPGALSTLLPPPLEPGLSLGPTFGLLPNPLLKMTPESLGSLPQLLPLNFQAAPRSSSLPSTEERVGAALSRSASASGMTPSCVSAPSSVHGRVAKSVASLSVRDLKRVLNAAGVAHSSCVEKDHLVELVTELMQGGGATLSDLLASAARTKAATSSACAVHLSSRTAAAKPSDCAVSTFGWVEGGGYRAS